jgi:phosphoglycerate dehydrogenase-like enzyme
MPLFYREAPAPKLTPVEEAVERERLEETLAQTEIVFAQSAIPGDLTARAPNLRWIQISSAGVDRLPDDVLASGVTITSASGIHAVPIAEYVLAYMLYFAKSLPTALENKQASRWQSFVAQELYGATLGIVGIGAIGQNVARIAKAFGMRVIAIKRSVNGERSELAEEVLPPTALPYLLAESDYVLLSLPATGQTRGLIGEAELRAMKRSAYLINIARGTIIDPDALLTALKEQWIAGAALDVTSPEPLPPNSELWTLPNVLVTPHITPATYRYVDRLVGLFCDNLRRYLDGQPLLNVFDPGKGY